MADQPDMLTAIEQATLTRLTDNIPALKSSGLQKDSRQLLRDTSVAVAVLDGKFNKIGQACFRNECTVSVLLKFKNMQSEEARRKGINPLVIAAIQYLLGQKLGLSIGPLQPVRFRDVTTEDKYEAGVIEYLLEFSTWFDIRKLAEEELGDLVTLAINYLLKPGDDTVDATDILTTV
jgi:hypothetical protein